MPNEGKGVMIRAVRLELCKPLDASWDVIGPMLRTLSKATPKLLNAAMDARIAIEVVGRDAVKDKIAPMAKASSAEGIAYQAVLRAEEKLQEWGIKKKHPFAVLDVPGGMASAIGRAASQAYARRDQERAHFASERILVRAAETSLSKDSRGIILTVKLATEGRVRFAIAHSWGTHRDTLDAIASGELPHGDCKLQYDERRRKWYAMLAYQPKDPVPRPIDTSRVLVVHRGVRNVLYALSSTGERGVPFPGAKFIAQRTSLRARMREARRISEFERGLGSSGHGKNRRYETYSKLEDKLARSTHTFCQQAAAWAVARATHLGCGLMIIEDYGGIEPDEDPRKRRVLDHGPLYQIKQCIAHACEREGITLRETSAAYISTTCPRCNAVDARAHNLRTGIFHCRTCGFDRPADLVAAFWMLDHGGADMTVYRERLRRERDLADQLRGEERIAV